MPKILVIFGTRPEAIKLCPVVLYLQQFAAGFQTLVCVTAQHRELLDQVLTAFGVAPDYDLDLMLPGQTLFQSTSRILSGLEDVLQRERPDMVVVQGDTTTTFCGALAAFYVRAPVAHVEAGLRTGDIEQPFPEEMNRVLTTRLTRLHFAPTAQSAANLRQDHVPEECIFVTGNTGIDALLYMKARIEQEPWALPGSTAPREWPWLQTGRKVILVTGHRRENFGVGFERICEALNALASRPDVELVYPIHPNPNVLEPVRHYLAGKENVHLIEPQDYVPFVDLMRHSFLILTDSGGVQEEAPSLGKPVLVMREKTERPEALEAGTSRLVGTDPKRIIEEAELLLDDRQEYARRSAIHNPYGDGKAAQRICEIMEAYFRRSTLAAQEVSLT